MTGPRGHQDWATSKSGLRVCLSLDFLHTLGVLPVYQLQGEEEQLPCGPGCTFGTLRPVIQVGFPTVVSLYLCVCSEESLFFFSFFLFYSSWDVNAGEMRW